MLTDYIMNDLNDYIPYDEAKEALLKEVDALLRVKYPVSVRTNIPYDRVCSILEEYELKVDILGSGVYLVY